MPLRNEDPAPYDYEKEFCRPTASLRVGAAVDAAHDIAGERFAGAWIDNDLDPPKVTVAMVGLTADDEAAIARAMGEDADQVVAVGATYGNETLRAVQEALGEALREAGISRSIGVHDPTNQVFLAVPDDEREAALAVIGDLKIAPEMVRFEEYHRIIACR